jgi:hypothetical protein
MTIINTNYTYSDKHFTPFMMPNYVGGYRLGGEFGLRINLQKKPNWLHRTMMKLCLGWEWIDTSN